MMNIEVTDLYNDKVWAEIDALLDTDKRNELLTGGQQHCESLGVDGIDCSIEITSPMTKMRSFYEGFAKPKKSKLNRALVLTADFDPYSFKGVVSISTFGGSTVMGVYKTVSREGEKVFVLNHSAEARKRTVIGLLQNIEAIERFFLVDKSIDRVAEFVESELKSALMVSLPSPE